MILKCSSYNLKLSHDLCKYVNNNVGLLYVVMYIVMMSCLFVICVLVE